MSLQFIETECDDTLPYIGNAMRVCVFDLQLVVRGLHLFCWRYAPRPSTDSEIDPISRNRLGNHTCTAISQYSNCQWGDPERFSF